MAAFLEMARCGAALASLHRIKTTESVVLKLTH